MKHKSRVVFLTILFFISVFSIGAVFAAITANISDVSIFSDLTGHTTKCIDGSQITAGFNSTEELFSVDDLKITDDLAMTFSVVENGGIFHYEGKVVIPDDFGTQYKELSNLKINITDIHGNRDTIDFGHINYYPDLTVSDFVCKTDNTENEKVAINGSKVYFSFTANQPVSISQTPQFLGSDLIFNTIDHQTYFGSYDVTSFSENRMLQFPTVKIKDFRGNEQDVSCDEKVVYYKTGIISSYEFATSHGDDQTVVKGDTLIYSFKSDRELTITGKVRINDEELNLIQKKNGESDFTYSCSYKVIKDRWDDLAAVSVDVSDIKYSDGYGYKDVSLEKETKAFTFYRQLEKGQNVTNYSFTTTNAGKTTKGKSVAKNGDTTTVKFETNRKVTIESAKINGYDVHVTLKDDLVYQAEIVLSDGIDSEEIPVHIVVYDPKTGTKVTITEEDFDKILYYAPIKITLDSYQSDHHMAHSCINGNTIKAKFHSNHPVIISESKIGNHDVAAQSSDQVNWTIEIPVNNNFIDLEDIGFYISASDCANNTDVSLNNDKGIRYYAPLEINKNITELTVVTSNTGKTPDGFKVIKKGDAVSVFFKANRAVNVKDAYIGLIAASVSSMDNKEWAITAKVDSCVDNAAIPISLTIVDPIGNPNLSLKESDFESVVFYDEIKMQLDSFETNNPNPKLAKNGDIAKVQFHTNHPVNINAAMIGKYDVAPVSDDGINWRMTLELDNHFEDLECFGFYVKVNDNASNASKTLVNDNTIQYYAPIVVSDLTMVSSNDRDCSKYIKKGESIALHLKSNHGVGIYAEINGESTTIVSDAPDNILITGDIGDLDDQQSVYFSIVLSDIAGNTSPVLTEENVNNTIIYYAPITGSSYMAATFSKTEGYVKNGDTLTLSIQTNHDTNGIGASIQGREVGISGNQTTYTIPFDESYLPEGMISYHVNVEDAAGNTFGIGENTSVIYDRTSPSVQFNPELSGFTNQIVNVKTMIQDTNIDNGDIFVKLNGDDRTAGGHTSEYGYEKSLSVDQEGAFSIEAMAVDKAGNISKQVSGTIIIDKTDPVITVIDIDLDEAPAYQTGFVLADHFDFKDDHLKNINCILTNRTGIGSTKAWNVFAAINDEGFMTGTISADDMASNISDSIRYSFYTDGTAPKTIIKDKSTGKVIDEKSKLESGINTIFEISLDNIWVGNEKPDHFTMLEIRDDKNNVIKDYVTGADTNSAEYKIAKEGEYTIRCKAIDDVGNETKEMYFKIRADKNNVTITPTTKDDVIKTGFIVGVCAAGIGIGLVVTILIARKKKKTIQATP